MFCALGFDLGSEQLRREALQRAIDTGTPQMSGALNLVQDNSQAMEVIFYPIYRQGANTNSVEERRSALQNLASTPIVVEELFQGITEHQSQNIEFELFEIVKSSNRETLLYDSDHNNLLKDAAVEHHRFHNQESIRLLGAS